MNRSNDFKREYFEEGKILLKKFFATNPDGTLSTTWGQGKWWLSKRLGGYEFYINQDWLQRKSQEQTIRFVSFDNCCDLIKQLVEFDIWGHYIGNAPGWSLRWLSAVKSACSKYNIL